MKNIKRLISLLCLAFVFSLCCQNSATAKSGLLLSNQKTLAALSNWYESEFSQNDILFYDPSSCINIDGACGGDITATDDWGRLRETVEKYGAAAINMQIEYGIPWEIPFVHMWAESHMGTSGLAVSIDRCGKYNWMGYTYAPGSLYGLTESEMTCKIYLVTGATAAQYDNVADMMAALATDFLRNGHYDAAFIYATQENFNLDEFLAKETDGIYCDLGCSTLYVASLHTILPTIREVAATHNWPTSEQLMHQKNISKGGKWPVNGDIKKQINAAPHSLHASCGGSDSSTGSSSSTSSVSGDQITWIGDSYSFLSYSTLTSKFPGVDVGPSVGDANSYIMSSKAVSHEDPDGLGGPSCLNILRGIIAKNQLRPYLVFACGTNWGWTDDDITQFENLLNGGTTKAVVVTSKIPGNNYTDSNNRLRKLAESNDRIFLADWTSVYNEAYFNDGIHPGNPPGYEKWYGVISEALAKASGASCTTFSGEYPEYKQSEGPWATLPYGDDNTISNAGCGAASIAMLATVAAGQDIYPNDIADLLGDKYYYNTRGSGMANYDKIVGEHYGFEVETVAVNEGNKDDIYNKMKQYLNNGYMLHMSGLGSKPFSSIGHYIGIFSIDGEDRVQVADSAHGNAEYSLWDVINAGYHGDAFAAVRSSKRNTCAGLCRDSGSLAPNNATKPIEPLYEDSVDIACAAGTEDRGTYDNAHVRGKQVKIRLCAVINIKSTDTDDGYARVNSRVSGAFYALAEYAKAQGITLTASSTFRTYEKQQYFYNCYQNQNCNNGNYAAAPGRSNHEGGLAIDFNVTVGGPVDQLFKDHLSDFGLKRPMTSEPWHVDPGNPLNNPQ